MLIIKAEIHFDHGGGLQVRPRSFWGGVGQEELLSAGVLGESNVSGAQVTSGDCAVSRLLLLVGNCRSLTFLILSDWFWILFWCPWKVCLHHSYSPAQHVGAAVEARAAGGSGHGGPIWAGVHTQRRNLDHCQQETLARHWSRTDQCLNSRNYLLSIQYWRSKEERSQTQNNSWVFNQDLGNESLLSLFHGVLINGSMNGQLFVSLT